MINKIFDTHAHYDDEAFDEDREILLSAMNDSGVGNIVNVGATIESSKMSVEIADRYDFIYASVGVHPNETGQLTDRDMQQLKEWTNNDKVVAIGEIGLDYHFMEPDADIQKMWFRKQLDVAVDTGMPVIIHSRDAAQDTMEIIKEYTEILNGGVIHCYSYSTEMAKDYLDMGYYLGIGGVLTFKNAKKLKEVVAMAPLERIVLETDCPYLAPEPNRGKRNNSSLIEYVIKAISEIKNVSIEQILETTNKNARDLYKIS